MSNRARAGRRLLFAFLVLFALSGVVHAGPGWWGDLDKGAIVDLGDVIASPLRYDGKKITFFCIFRKQDTVFLQRGTPFNHQKYDNIAVWPDGSAVWDRAVYPKDFPFLYVRRAHYQRDALLKTREFTRLEITGRIRAIVQNRPFIELDSYRVTGHRLGKGTVMDVVNANAYSHNGNDELAVYRLMQALRDDLPPRYDIRIRQLAAKALRRLGREEDADLVERGGSLDGDAPAQPNDGDIPTPDVPSVNPLMTDDMPGSEGAPESAPSDEPIASRGDPDLPDFGGPPPPGPLAPRGQPANPLVSGDLPGTPVNPFMSGDLPGAESSAPEPGPLVPPAGRPKTPVKKPAVKVPPAPKPLPRAAGAPPKRRPRLVGVK